MIHLIFQDMVFLPIQLNLWTKFFWLISKLWSFREPSSWLNRTSTKCSIIGLMSSLVSTVLISKIFSFIVPKKNNFIKIWIFLRLSKLFTLVISGAQWMNMIKPRIYSTNYKEENQIFHLETFKFWTEMKVKHHPPISKWMNSQPLSRKLSIPMVFQDTERLTLVFSLSQCSHSNSVLCSEIWVMEVYCWVLPPIFVFKLRNWKTVNWPLY